MAATVVHWFRQDLRLTDNPALLKAAEQGTVLPIYILDDANAGNWKMGAASRWWLHRSLAALDDALSGRLNIYRGRAEELLPEIVQRCKAASICWNRCYEPWRIERDKGLKARLTELGFTVQSYNGSLLWEPWQVLNRQGRPYKVFTPYYRKGCLSQPAPQNPLAAPAELKLADPDENRLPLADLELLEGYPWHAKLTHHWLPGEAGARQRLNDFLEQGLAGYREGRDFPARDNISKLSPALHFGELSPRQVWYAATAAALEKGLAEDLDCFHSELAWREFSYYLLYHFPQLATDNFQQKFDRFPWQQEAESLATWQRGLTGIPIVDAGMRELWETGFMHNRVRMIVASFLVKNQLQHWHGGERWFWDTLLDADLASNSAGWQWVAGCGADAAPYFRIFNPVTQGQKFDANGLYVRRFVPELAGLPDKHLHAPWMAPDSVLNHAGVVLGETYPQPLVDLKASRQRALDAYAGIKVV